MKPNEIQYRRDLHKLFEGVPKGDLGSIVEVGVAEGNFSEEMLNWPVKFPRVYSVDRWINHDTKGDSGNPQSWHDANYCRVVDRLAKFEDRSKIVRRNSVEAASLFGDGELDLVYIDADHSYEGCKADIEAWFPKVKADGFMAFHDYINPAYGVNRAVKEFCQARGLAIHTMAEDKPEDAGALILKKC